MDRIGNKDPSLTNFHSLRNSEASTPLQSCTSSAVAWPITTSRTSSIADKFFETFQYKDEVTLKKTHMNYLCKSPNQTIKVKKPQNTKKWTNEKYCEEKE